MGKPLFHAAAALHVPRFLAVVEKIDGGCWYLTGRARENGYGTMQLNGMRVSGHRFAYAAFVGDVPADREIDHLCRDRACVNPDHLDLVSRRENLRRRDDAGLPLGHLPVIDRLKARRRLDAEGGCWLWTGARVRGYGVATIDNKTQYVHRVAYELLVGPILPEHTLDHLCRRVRCFNPAHLEPVSRAENARRMPGEGRRRRTCRNGHIGEEVGRNPDGSCGACHPERARTGPPRPRRADVDVRCAHGHVYAEVGRYRSGGCVACQYAKDQARRKGPRPPVQFCPRGHDTFVVGRKGRTGECRECAREYARRRYGGVRTRADLDARCRNGHERTPDNTRLVNRVRDGVQQTERVCVPCRRVVLDRYAQRRRTS